jgi:ADP-heptose:LPS heptosyltransferase
MMRSPLLSIIKKIIFYIIFVFPPTGAALFKRVFRLNSNDHFPRQIRNIAVFQLGHLGDYIHTIPLLRNLKKNFPLASITLIGGEWNKTLSESCSSIDRYIVFNNWLWDRREKKSFFRFLCEFLLFVKVINKIKVDIGIELKGHINSIYLLYALKIKRTVGFNYSHHGALLDYRIPMTNSLYEKDRLLSILPVCGMTIVDNHFEFSIAKDKEKDASDYLENHLLNTDKPLISIFPGAPFAPRRWPAEKYAELSEQIIINNIGIPFFIGGPADNQTFFRIQEFSQHELIHWIGDDIQLIACFISKSNLFIGNDTGPMHIAVALNIPTIAFFGSGNFIRWGPKPPHIILRAEVPCSPCDLESDTCKRPDINCINRISVEDAFLSVKRLLKKK